MIKLLIKPIETEHNINKTFDSVNNTIHHKKMNISRMMFDRKQYLLRCHLMECWDKKNKQSYTNINRIHWTNF